MTQELKVRACFKSLLICIKYREEQVRLINDRYNVAKNDIAFMQGT